jgi:hypothetical protein
MRRERRLVVRTPTDIGGRFEMSGSRGVLD